MIFGDSGMIVLATVFVLLAMYLVAIEQAFTKVSKVRATELVDEGVRGAERLLVVVNDRARYVNVILLVRLALETFAVVFVTVICLRAWDSWVGAVVAALLMMVIAFVALGVAPRTLGQQHSLGVALRGARLARLLAPVFGPLATSLIKLGNAITPGKGYRQGPFATQAELREMVDLAEADDVIEEDERQMIHSVFELGDTFAREVMVPRTEMVWIERDKSLRQAMSLCLRSGFSRIPVIGENLDDVVGVIYLKDLSRRLYDRHEAESRERVEQLMRPVTYVPDSKVADDLLREMQADHVHFAIVVDEYGGTAGLLTIEDILEEIVGEIADEYDVAEIPESAEVAEGGWRVSSRMQLDDFAELLDIKLSEEKEGVETVGGLLANRLGVVPIAGSRIEVEGYELVAESVAGRRNRIGTVLVTKRPEPETETETEDDE